VWTIITGTCRRRTMEIGWKERGILPFHLLPMTSSTGTKMSGRPSAQWDSCSPTIKSIQNKIPPRTNPWHRRRSVCVSHRQLALLKSDSQYHLGALPSSAGVVRLRPDPQGLFRNESQASDQGNRLRDLEKGLDGLDEALPRIR
jgi:hypothetical protein